nr:uncharacterized protein LOC109731642 [Aegilops tauschii subsp. strangulata]
MAAAAGAARLSSSSHLMDDGVGSRSSRSGRRLPPEFGRDLAVLMILKFMLLCGYKNMAVNNIYAFQRLQMPQGLPNKGSLKRNGLTKKGEARAAVGPWCHRRHSRRSVGRRDVRICPALTPPSDHPRRLFLRPRLHPLNFCARVLPSVWLLLKCHRFLLLPKKY